MSAISLRQQMLQIAEVLPYGIVLLDPMRKVIFANRAAESLLNRKTGSLKRRLASEVLPDIWTKDFDPEMRRSLRVTINDRSITMSFWSLIWSETTAGDSAEQLAGIIWLTDMPETEALQAEVCRLREACKDLNAIFESSFDEIFVTDGDGKTLMVNSACEKLYGVPASFLIGRNVKELEQNGIFFPSITPAVLESKAQVTEVQNTKTGRQILATANPVFDADGKIVRIVTNSRDVTEFHDLKTRLKETEALANLYLSEIQALREQHVRVDGVVADSGAMRKVLQTVRKLASFDSTILFQGESGTGKDTVAKIVHRYSSRSSGPFIKVNCGAIPEPLMESELFGYVPGAFTGANRSGKIGVIELANKGTLFLNEIDALPLHLQVKMLHVIQEKQFMKVGDTKVISPDIRVIAASNKDLYGLVRQGRFREDLFYRLNVIQIFIPPLRDRKADIVPMVAHFLGQVCTRYAIEKNIAPAAMDLLLAYPWPGNVRELANAIERAVVVSSDVTIQPEDLPENVRTGSPYRSGSANEADDPRKAGRSHSPGNYRQAKDALDKEMLMKALKQCGTTRKAGELLGVSQSTIVRKMKHYGIEPVSTREMATLHQLG